MIEYEHPDFDAEKDERNIPDEKHWEDEYEPECPGEMMEAIQTWGPKKGKHNVE